MNHLCRLETDGEASPVAGVTLENVNAIPFVGLLNGIAIFPLDLATFRHEYASGAAYSAGTFLLAYSAFEVSMTIMAAFVRPCVASSPSSVVAPLLTVGLPSPFPPATQLYGLIMNVAVGQQTSVRIYFEFVTTIFCCLSFGESISVIFCAFVGQMGVAVSLVSTGAPLALSTPPRLLLR